MALLLMFSSRVVFRTTTCFGTTGVHMNKWRSRECSSGMFRSWDLNPDLSSCEFPVSSLTVSCCFFLQTFLASLSWKCASYNSFKSTVHPAPCGLRNTCLCSAETVSEGCPHPSASEAAGSSDGEEEFGTHQGSVCLQENKQPNLSSCSHGLPFRLALTWFCGFS